MFQSRMIFAAVLAVAMVLGCDREEPASPPSPPPVTPPPTPQVQIPSISDMGAKANDGTADTASLADATREKAESLLAQAGQYIEQNKLDEAENILKQLEGMKSSLSASTQKQLDGLRASLTAARAAGGIKIPTTMPSFSK